MAAETPEHLIQRVARRIVQLRHSAGLSQEEFAEALATSVQYVSRIEVGENLTLATLTKIAGALAVPVNALLEAPDARPDTPRRGRPRKRPSKA